MIPALSAVGSTLAPLAASAAPIGGAATNVAASFADVLSDVASGAVSSLRAGEATSILGVEGKASVQQVVESVMNAEQSLHTAIAIRDKAVSAFQSISQMAI